MTHHRESPDLRATNDRMARKRKRRAQFRARTQPTRDRVRRLALLEMLTAGGSLR